MGSDLVISRTVLNELPFFALVIGADCWNRLLLNLINHPLTFEAITGNPLGETVGHSPQWQIPILLSVMAIYWLIAVLMIARVWSNIGRACTDLVQLPSALIPAPMPPMIGGFPAWTVVSSVSLFCLAIQYCENVGAL